MLKCVADLHELAGKRSKKRLAVCFAHDDLVIKAVADAMKLNIIDPILIGDPILIAQYAAQEGILDHVTILAETDPVRAVRVSMDLINQGKADLLMKGLIDTKDMLKGVVNSEFGIKSRPLLSHVGIVSYPGFDRVLFATDGAMNIQPTVDEKIQLIENAVWLTRKLGYDCPNVGLVSAVEKVNPKILSTVEAEQIKAYYAQNPPTFHIDGPFAIDNLVSMESVKHKNIQSPIAGKADILIFPNLDAGNVFYKTSVFLCQADAAGIVIGAKVPIVLTSRADEALTKLHSIVLGVMLCD
jgi:phosphate butyryltransferase